MVGWTFVWKRNLKESTFIHAHKQAEKFKSREVKDDGLGGFEDGQTNGPLWL